MACLAQRWPSKTRPPERRLALQRVCAPPPLFISGPEPPPAPARRRPACRAAAANGGGTWAAAGLSWAAAATAAAAAATAALARPCAQLPACRERQRPQRATARQAAGKRGDEPPLPPPLPAEPVGRTPARPGPQCPFAAWQMQWPAARDLMKKWATVSDCPDIERALLKKLSDGRSALARAAKAQRMAIWAMAVPGGKVSPELHPDRAAEALVMAENKAAGTKSGWGGFFEEDCLLIHHVLLRPTSWEAERAELEAPKARGRRCRAAKQGTKANSKKPEECTPVAMASKEVEDAESKAFAKEDQVNDVEHAKPRAQAKAKAKATAKVNGIVEKVAHQELEVELASISRGRRAKAREESDAIEDVETLSFLPADDDKNSEDAPPPLVNMDKAARKSVGLGRSPRLIDGEEDDVKFSAFEAKFMAEIAMREENEFDEGDAKYALALMAKVDEVDTTSVIAPIAKELPKAADGEELLRGAVRAWVDSLAPKVVTFKDPEELERRGLQRLLAAKSVDPLAGCGL